MATKTMIHFFREYFVRVGLILFSILSLFFVITCQPATSYSEDDVVFRNEMDGAVLAATLTLPSGDESFPIAVLISGSGSQDRDETAYGHKPFKVLSGFLAENGVGTLRFDDRGTGGSKGDVWNATLEVLASDASAGLEYLRSRIDTENHQIGLIGHSLGAMQGSIIASKDPDLSFLVMLGGIGIPFIDNHIKADSLTNRLKGECEEVIEAGGQLLHPLLEAMKTAVDYNSARDTAVQIIAGWQSTLSGRALEELSQFTEKNPDFWVKNFAEEYATAIYRSCARFNPCDYLTKITCPVLSIIGEKDVQIVPENNEAIRKALIEGGNENFKILAPKDINHMFQKCETGLIYEYEIIEEDFNPEVMNTILNFIMNI